MKTDPTGELNWVEQGCVAACAYPWNEEALAALARHGVALLINLHEKAHDPSLLARYGLAEVHLPVPDFTAPRPEQLEQGVTAIARAIASGKRVAVHCAAGRGRTGTLLARYLVRRGLTPSEAIARIREVRPGSVETPAQELAVEAYANRLQQR